MERRSQKLEALLRRARQDPDVLAVVLFGSAARGEEGPASDVDVCLILDVHAAADPELAASRKRLAYLADFELDIHVFRQLPLYVRHRVVREGRVLYARDEEALYSLAIRTMKAFRHFRRIYHQYLEQVARG